MIAYHLVTSEPDHRDVMLGFEKFNLNSIYIPEESLLVGFVKWYGKKGLIKPYCEEIYCSRAQNIVKNNKNNTQGDVISEFNIGEKLVNILRTYNSEKEIKTTVDFDGSTSALINILSGELIKKNWLSRLFSYKF